MQAAALDMTADLIIPALDEEGPLALVLAGLPRAGTRLDAGGAAVVLRRIIVVDNGSRDSTARVAAAGGAEVVSEPKRGYGRACLAGIAHAADPPPDLAVFLDADHSDDPSDLVRVITPLARGEADLVIGSRALGEREPGAFTPVQAFGNALSAALIRLLWRAEITDLGPFRAISWPALTRLDMRDRDYGWTVEMQTRAYAAGLRVTEVPVRYRRRRLGRSKVAGTVRGVWGAGTKILWTIARVRLGG